MAQVVTLDLGPTFLGHAIRVGGELVCTLPPAAFTDVEVQAHVRELMEGQGTDCRQCRGCQVGAAQ